MAAGVVARDVGFELAPVVQFPDAGEGAFEAVVRDQRPDRVAVAPLLVERAAGVEVGFALDGGVYRGEPPPVREAAGFEDLDQFIEGGVAAPEGVGGFRDQAIVPVAVAELLLGAGVDREDAAGFEDPGELAEDPAVGGEAFRGVVGEVVEDLVDHDPVEGRVLEG